MHLQGAIEIAEDSDGAERAEQMTDDEDSGPPEVGGVDAQLDRNEPVDDRDQALSKLGKHVSSPRMRVQAGLCDGGANRLPSADARPVVFVLALHQVDRGAQT